jgi:hypothetical protein
LPHVALFNIEGSAHLLHSVIFLILQPKSCCTYFNMEGEEEDCVVREVPVVFTRSHAGLHYLLQVCAH